MSLAKQIVSVPAGGGKPSISLGDFVTWWWGSGGRMQLLRLMVTTPDTRRKSVAELVGMPNPDV